MNSDAIAYATLRFAMNTSAVDAVRGKGNFKPPKDMDQLLPANLRHIGRLAVDRRGPIPLVC